MAYTKIDRDYWSQHDLYVEDMEQYKLWEKQCQEEDLKIQAALDSMTEDEYKLLYELNANLTKAKQNLTYRDVMMMTVEEHKAATDILDAARTAYNKAAEKWPILADGF
jgi:hypothetical protein